MPLETQSTSQIAGTSVQSVDEPARSSKAARWIGRALSTLAVLFLLFDGGAKVMKVAPVLEASAKLDVPESVIPGLGVTLIIATLIYAITQTSVLGAIILTGYLGGATWTHVRMGRPMFPMVFPAIFGAILWGALLLREPRMRTLLPLRL